MLAETVVIAEWFDYESTRDIKMTCECERIIPDDVLETLCTGEHESYVCPCGYIVTLADLDALADALEEPVPRI